MNSILIDLLHKLHLHIKNNINDGYMGICKLNGTTLINIINAYDIDYIFEKYKVYDLILLRVFLHRDFDIKHLTIILDFILNNRICTECAVCTDNVDNINSKMETIFLKYIVTKTCFTEDYLKDTI